MILFLRLAVVVVQSKDVNHVEKFLIVGCEFIARLQSSRLQSHSLRAAFMSRDCGAGETGLHLMKYLPETPFTSGEEAR